MVRSALLRGSVPDPGDNRYDFLGKAIDQHELPIASAGMGVSILRGSWPVSKPRLLGTARPGGIQILNRGYYRADGFGRRNRLSELAHFNDQHLLQLDGLQRCFIPTRFAYFANCQLDRHDWSYRL